MCSRKYVGSVICYDDPDIEQLTSKILMATDARAWSDLMTVIVDDKQNLKHTLTDWHIHKTHTYTNW